jgi:hypothetical protein
VIAMTKDLNPTTPFLFPGVGEQAGPSTSRAVAGSPRTNDRTPGAPCFPPFLAGRALFPFE